MGALSAAGAIVNSVTDMLTASKSSAPVPNNAITSTIVQPSKKSINKLANNNAFIAQEFKTVTAPIDFTVDNTLDKTKLSQLTSKEISSLSTLSGTTIKNDADLNKALGVMSTKFSNNLSMTNMNIAGKPVRSSLIPTDFDGINAEVLAGEVNQMSPILNLTQEVVSSFIPGVPNVTGPGGAPISGMPNNANYTQTQATYDMLRKLCGNVSMNMYNNGANVGLYNALLALLMKLGLSGLLSQAMQCAQYFGVGGVSTIRKNLPYTYNYGDYSTYHTATSGIGQGNVPYRSRQFSTLSSNIPSSTVVPSGTVTDITSALGLSNSRLTTKSVPNTNYSAISLPKVNGLGNSSVQNALVGTSMMKLMKKLPF